MAETVALNESQVRKHDEVLLDPLDIRGRLMLVDPQSLTLDQHIAWNEQIFQVGLSIISMERDLHNLKAANDVIAAIGATLGTITSIATLLA